MDSLSAQRRGDALFSVAGAACTNSFVKDEFKVKRVLKYGIPRHVSRHDVLHG
eukprot:IDg21385t1